MLHILHIFTLIISIFCTVYCVFFWIFYILFENSQSFQLPPLPDPPLQWFILVFRTCHHHRESFSQHFWGVFAPQPWLIPSLWEGFSLFMKPLLARLSCHTSFPCCCYKLTCSVSLLFCAWLLPYPFPSDVPGQHRRAFITKMQVQVPTVDLLKFSTFWKIRIFWKSRIKTQQGLYHKCFVI